MCGQTKRYDFHVVNVTKPILSVSWLCENGVETHLAKESFLRLGDGHEPLIRKGGVYFVEAQTVNAVEDMMRDKSQERCVRVDGRTEKPCIQANGSKKSCVQADGLKNSCVRVDGRSAKSCVQADGFKNHAYKLTDRKIHAYELTDCNSHADQKNHAYELTEQKSCVQAGDAENDCVAVWKNDGAEIIANNQRNRNCQDAGVKPIVQDPIDDDRIFVESGAEMTPVAHDPSEIEKLKHQLTHLPFQPWCTSCVKGKAQAKPHKRTEHIIEDSGLQ